jgi:hypothetical protein
MEDQFIHVRVGAETELDAKIPKLADDQGSALIGLTTGRMGEWGNEQPRTRFETARLGMRWCMLYSMRFLVWKAIAKQQES